MSDLKSARANSAAALSAEIRRRSDPVCSNRRWRVRFQELKNWSASFGAAAICILLVCVACVTPATARGGHMHGMGGFGMHEGHRMGMGAGGGLLTPTYVLITVSKITDAEAFKVTVRDLMAADAAFAGRLAADVDKPVAWEGTAPEHVVMIQFDNADQAQAWKSSDALKSSTRNSIGVRSRLCSSCKAYPRPPLTELVEAEEVVVLTRRRSNRM